MVGLRNVVYSRPHIEAIILSDSLVLNLQFYQVHKHHSEH